MHVLQRTFCVVLIYLSILPRVLSILLKVLTNISRYDDPRRPTFTENVGLGLSRAQEIARSSLPVLMLEVYNGVAPGAQGSSNLDGFLKISMDVLVTESPIHPYKGQRATVYGSASTWGSWGMNLVGFRDVDDATAIRAFAPYQIIMDQDAAHDVLRRIGFTGPWRCIYLCKLPPNGILLYIFQERREEGSLQIRYQMVEVETGRVRLYQGQVRQPCSRLTLDLTTNATFQAGSMNRTDLPASPSRRTNVTSQNVFENDRALWENITNS